MRLGKVELKQPDRKGEKDHFVLIKGITPRNQSQNEPWSIKQSCVKTCKAKLLEIQEFDEAVIKVGNI